MPDTRAKGVADAAARLRQRQRALAVEGQPEHTAFMDEAMRALWSGLRRMPQDLRLYGGTALALYLNHRTSTDFDFATPGGLVDLQLVRTIDAFAGPATVTGGDGMVDLVLHAGRDIKVTLMECGTFVPKPVLPPRRASNGVAVADPVDLVCAKLVAAAQRDVARDFVDLAAAERRWPGILEQGLDVARQATHHQRAALIANLRDPPPNAARELDAAARAALANHAAALSPVRRGQTRGRDA